MSTAATTPAKKATKKTSKPKVPAAHPQYKVMAAAAITSLKERGGSSRQAILKYIMANYKVGTDATKVNSRLKLGLKAAVKGGSLKQVKGTVHLDPSRWERSQRLPSQGKEGNKTQSCQAQESQEDSNQAQGRKTRG